MTLTIIEWVWYAFLIFLAASIVLWVYYICYRIANRGKNRENSDPLPASRLYDIEQGKHLTQIKDTLALWKSRLETILKADDSLLNLLPARIDDLPEFIFVKHHCSSIDDDYSGWLISLGISESRLNEMVSKKSSTEDIDSARIQIRNRIQEMVDLIDKSISTNEYLRTSCFYCPKKP